ncbi:FAD-binding domain-containing protein [Trametopsis cervina]|nr:FAD-binding domain-containing protein [Trametopsis cervina]
MLRALFATALFSVSVRGNVQHAAPTPTAVCGQIAKAISSASAVFYPGSANYTSDNEHWMESSTQQSTCSVEPGTSQDVGTILKLIGSANVPFAVKGGGHATNQGYSSTSGVQIAMSRFNQVVYHASTSSVDVGAGLIWDDVYAALEQYGVNVVGGRASGIGVAGFSLGGGYSWLTNQYGLTIDTILAFELVLPNGTVLTVNSSKNPDLFFALKGGYNNFGIVTKFTFKTFPQSQVWGGILVYGGDQLTAVNNATAKFADQVKDPKAQIITTYNYIGGAPDVTQLLFYDGPTPPAGIFDDFLAIPSFLSDISTRSFLSLVQASPSSAPYGNRAVFNTVSLLKITPQILDSIVNETVSWGAKLTTATSGIVSYDVEPFLSTLFSKGSNSAYPPDRSRALLPLNVYFAWADATQDNVMRAAAVQSAQQLTTEAVSQGQNIANLGLYGNYAIAGTQTSRIFGNNLSALNKIKNQYDPNNLMGWTGGWRL